MLGNDRKTIGVFICRAVDDFQVKLCTGISERAKELGYNVAFFSWFGNFLVNATFSAGDAIIFDLPDYAKLDGVILALDTVDQEDTRILLEQSLKKCGDIPIVSIRTKTESYYDILVDDDTSMEEIIRHYIYDHKYKDICFLAGPKGYIDSEKRLACFRQLMEEAGNPVNEDQIFHGDFWKSGGGKACDYLIDQRGKLPEAIICANDYMGISVCNELIERGIQIPEQVAVCGYDGVWETAATSPALTTVRIPFYEMGTEGVSLIHDVITGIKRDRTTYIQPECILSESCGCVEIPRHVILRNRKNFYINAEAERELSTRNTYMAVELGKADTFERIEEVVEKNICYNPNWRQLNLCTIAGVEEEMGGVKADQGFGKQIKLCFSLGRKNKKQVKTSYFHKNQLLPSDVTGEEPQVYYFLPLLYRDLSFGYVALEIEKGGGYSVLFHNWMVSLGSALEATFNRNRLTNLVERLEDLHVRDVLTGLYNRRGYEKYGACLFDQAREEKKSIFIAVFDLDGLKSINDNYGHGEGDVAICEVANALQEAADSTIHGANNPIICARTGGDEFSVAGICMEGQCTNYLQVYTKYIEQVNEKLGKKYSIAASWGYVHAVPQEHDVLENFLKESDKKMYKQKTERKAR